MFAEVVSWGWIVRVTCPMLPVHFQRLPMSFVILASVLAPPDALILIGKLV